MGVGTTIKVLFPTFEGLTENLTTRRAVASKQWKGSGTILLVDDEEAIVAVTGDLLRRMGFSVLTAANGDECVDIFRVHSEEIVCVLLDFTMPHLDGGEAFRELRRIRDDVKVVICSGYDHQKLTSRFVGKGLADYLQKPYGPDELWDKLSKTLDG